MEEVCTFILVPGQRLSPKGKPTAQFIKRLEEAARLGKELPHAAIILSGGATHEGFESEAAVGFKHLPESVSNKIYLEDKSRTTFENIIFVSRMLIEMGCERPYIIIVSQKGHLRRLRLAVKVYWPDILSTLELVEVGKETLLEMLIQCIEYAVMCLDTGEKYFSPLKRYLLSKFVD